VWCPLPLSSSADKAPLAAPWHVLVTWMLLGSEPTVVAHHVCGPCLACGSSQGYVCSDRLRQDGGRLQTARAPAVLVNA
jgi:hypothetical protein